MLRYVVRRMALVFPGLWILVSSLFILSKMVPGDPVLAAMKEQSELFSSADFSVSSRQYAQKSAQLGLDRPNFYFSILPATYDRQLYELPPFEQKFALELLKENVSWDKIQSLVKRVNELQDIEPDSTLQSESRLALITLSQWPADPKVLMEHAQVLMSDLSLAPRFQQAAKEIRTTSKALNANGGTKWQQFLPQIIWHGSDNQYHHWLSAVVTLDLGPSLVDGRSAWTKILLALRWTLLLNLISLMLAYGLGILLGTYAGWKGGSWDRVFQFAMYILYAIPIFWLATVLVVFFSTSEYGSWTNIFPATGIWHTSSNGSFMSMIGGNVTQLFIPVIALSVHLLAFVSRQMRSSMVAEKGKSYVWHARAFGIGERRIFWKHVFRNASSPLITMLGTLIPAAIGGSLVVEVICNVPGMGRLMFDAIFGNDWSVVIGVVLISGVLTMIGTLVSDVLYKWVDPRVSL
ncbi:MAG: ABC transporter permease [Saprospiraceae bacterium]|nr:ABC transporter permease [Saprospiraceae bacterium]